MKTIVVGNGILGQLTALRVAQAGTPVTMIGDPERAGSATLAAAAMLAAFGEIDAGVLASDAGRMKLEIGISATREWGPLAAELGVPLHTGTFVLDAGGLDDTVRFDALVAALVEYEEPHALVKPAQVPGYAPLRPARRALRLVREGWIDPRAVVAALDTALAAAGVERIAGSAARVLGAGAIELADGRVIEGTHCLLANGARLTSLLTASALPLRVPVVLYGVGSTIEVASASTHTACLRGRGTYLAPHADRIVLGATNVVVAEPVDDAGAAAKILDTAATHLDHHLADAQVLRVTTGWRPTTADGYPLIGATSVPGLVIASGTRRDGFHLAPVIAEHLARLLHGERGDPRFRPFSPEREVQSPPR
ncbi:MAG: FAD-binding oxidoreductase [Myxococcales bacterium]|nr:FAD-binding oxidoreductase [Myxococcales bacterium]